MTWRIGIQKTHVKTVRNCLNSQEGSGGVSLHLSDILEIWLKFYICTEKPVLRGHSKRRPKLVFKTEYRLMQVKSIAECSKRREHSAIQ